MNEGKTWMGAVAIAGARLWYINSSSSDSNCLNISFEVHFAIAECAFIFC